MGIIHTQTNDKTKTPSRGHHPARTTRPGGMVCVFLGAHTLSPTVRRASKHARKEFSVHDASSVFISPALPCVPVDLILR